jgi:hypothetical protein
MSHYPSFRYDYHTLRHAALCLCIKYHTAEYSPFPMRLNLHGERKLCPNVLAISPVRLILPNHLSFTLHQVVAHPHSLLYLCSSSFNIAIGLSYQTSNPHSRILTSISVASFHHHERLIGGLNEANRRYSQDTWTQLCAHHADSDALEMGSTLRCET